MIGDNTLQGGTIYSVVTFFDKLVTGIVIILIEIKWVINLIGLEKYKIIFFLISVKMAQKIIIRLH
jgi:hypothetical protein